MPSAFRTLPDVLAYGNGKPRLTSYTTLLNLVIGREAIMNMQALNCTVAKPIDNDTFGVTLSPSPLEVASSYIGLPSVTVDSLDEIKNKVSSAFPSQKEVYVSIVLEQVRLPLLPTFLSFVCTS